MRLFDFLAANQRTREDVAVQLVRGAAGDADEAELRRDVLRDDARAVEAVADAGRFEHQLERGVEVSLRGV